MNQDMNHPTDRARRELAALAYLEAFEGGDLDALAAAWAQADGDGELERILCELTEGLAAEQEPSPGWHADARGVAELLRVHLPSAAAPPQPVSGPLTAGDVAARIAGDDALLSKLTPEGRDANARLLGDRTPLPPQLGVESLRRWSAGLTPPAMAGETADAAYWRLFRHAAVLMAMGRAHRVDASAAAAARLAAARQAGRGADRPGSGGEGGTHP